MSYVMNEIWASSTNYGATRPTSNIKYIVIHYTSNNGDTAENNGKYFQGANRKASAHYFVDSDSIVHSVPDNRIAWSVGGNKYNNAGGRLYGIAKNANTLNIELCDDTKDNTIYPSNATIENALSLVRELMKKYGISESNVIRHYDVNGKSCPSYWVDNSRWENEFHSKISHSLTSSTTSAPTPYRVRKSWSDVKSQTGAYNNLDNAKRECGSGYNVYDANGNVVYSNGGNSTSTPKPSVSTQSNPSGNSLVRLGQQHAINFTGHTIAVDGLVGKETNRMKARVLQHAINLDYKKGIGEDGIFGNKSKSALGSHYVKKGEKQYMVTAAEILMYLNGIDPNGVECPGKYGNGLVRASKQKFGDDGLKITASEFLKLI